MAATGMHDFLNNAVRLYPDHTAVEEPAWEASLTGN